MSLNYFGGWEGKNFKIQKRYLKIYRKIRKKKYKIFKNKKTF